MFILNSLDAQQYFRRIIHSDVEQLWCCSLAANNKLLAAKMLFQGTVDSCPAHPRDIFRFVCHTNASSFILAHNHPSGDPTPSEEDFLLTKKIRAVGRLMEIPMLDHIIITTSNKYFSFTDYLAQKKRVP